MDSNMTNLSRDNKRRQRFRFRYVVLGLAAVALVAFVLFVHPFLAVTQRVDADVLVVEGWIPDYMFPAAAREFRDGHYAFMLVSGLQNDPADQSGGSPDFAHAATELKRLGVPAQQLIECPAPFARWLRTSKTARAVRLKADQAVPHYHGVNVVTAGPHARETWVAYQHIFESAVPVGIISIPKNNYPPNRWWLSRQGLIWVPKDFLAWLKEVIFGLRS
jgi:hypothetical protein